MLLLRRIVTLGALPIVLLLLSAACSDDTAPPQGPDIDAPDEHRVSEARSPNEGRIVDQAVDRFEAKLNVGGSLRPGGQLEVQLTARARLPTREAHLRIDMPELESARRTGFDEGFRAPVEKTLPPEARDREPMARGSRTTLHQRVDVPSPGYYRVVGYVHQSPEDPVVHKGRFVVDASLVEKWVWISEEGGRVTDTFDPSVFPDSARIAAGPLRPRPEKGVPAEPSAGKASLVDGFLSAVQRLGAVLTGNSASQTISIEVIYYNAHTGQYEPYPFVKEVVSYTDYSDYYDPEEVTWASWLGSSGTSSAGCPGIYESSHSYDYFTDGRDVVMTDSTDSDYAAGTITIVHGQCDQGPFTEQAIGTDAVLDRAFDEMNFAVRGGEQAFARNRTAIRVKILNSNNSFYSVSNDEIVLRHSAVSGQWAIFLTAHEYGHAYDTKALGGFNGGNCPDPHFLSGSHNMACAFSEGFADYYAAWSRRALPSTEYDYPGRFEDNIYYPASGGNGDPNDGSLIEGAVAAFLYDVTDGANEPHDAVAFPGSYLGDVWATCFAFGRANRIDEVIWCLEDAVDGSAYNTYFPQGFDPGSQSHTATKPSGWSQQAVRDLWLEDLYGNW